VENTTGAQLQAAHATDGTTRFLRPEDCAWDTITNNKCYFATTDRYDSVKDGVSTQIGRSRLYVLEFSDITNPLAGGNIRLLIDGTESLNMIDNIGVDFDGKITLVEDVGNQQHNGKLARFNPATGAIQMLARHDRSRNGDIGMPSIAPFSQDEEFSGNIDITEIMSDSILNAGGPNERWILMDDQQHYSIAGEKVEGGQLIAVHDVAPLNNVSVPRSGLVRDRRTGRFAQNVTIQNNNTSTQGGSFHLVLDRLSPNVTLVNRTGNTATFSPLGRPYITVTSADLPAGASATITLQFSNPSNTAINYTTRVLNSVTNP